MNGRLFEIYTPKRRKLGEQKINKINEFLGYVLFMSECDFAFSPLHHLFRSLLLMTGLSLTNMTEMLHC